ncbi:MAG: DUF4280 domain-containing protein [Hymenobacter sp.]|nr:DUF4280 domain-containing protein [Hymenobacter sp.]
MGVTPCMLQVKFNLTTEIYGQKLATELDKLPLINIGTFGVCKTTRTPCMPVPTVWNPVKNDVVVNGARLLLEDSVLPCTAGMGQISISLVAPPAPPAAPEKGLLDQLDDKLASLGPAGDPLRFQMGLVEGAWGGVVGIAEGLWGLAKLSAKLNMAVVDAALHPVETAQAISQGAQALAKPKTWQNAWDASQEALGKADQWAYDTAEWVGNGGIADWARKQSPRDWGKITGRVGFEAALAFGTAGTGTAANAVAKGGEAANVAAKGFEAVNALEKGAELTNAAGKLALRGPVTTGAEELAGRTAAREGTEAAAREGVEAVEGCASRSECTALGHPVDVASGMMFTEQIDFQLPGPIPFVWERVWYSRSVHRGALGHGWHHRYDLALAVGANGAAALRMADGRLAEFGPVAEGEMDFNRRHRLELHRSATEYRVWSLTERLWYVFALRPQNVPQPLLAVENTNGFAIRFAYDAHDYVRTCTDSAGRHLAFTTDPSGRITTIHGPHPEQEGSTLCLAQYAYDGAGNLATATDAEQHAMHFEYRGQLLTRETNRNGLSFYFEYDAADFTARCLHTWGDGGIYDTKLRYDSPLHTTAWDSYGHATQYEHTNGLVVRQLDALGNAWEWYYSEFGELELARDPLGHTTLCDYDARGNRMGHTAPGGVQVLTTYNGQGLPVTVVDANGSSWQWCYDEAGNLLEHQDPLGATTTYCYEQGLLATRTDAAGHTTRLTYDAQHLVRHLVTPDGAIRSREHDQLGRLVQLTDAAGHTQRRGYDRRGLLTSVQEPNGTRRRLSYDGEGNLVEVFDGAQPVTFEYAGLNQLARRQQAGTAVQFHYDLEGRLTGLTNEHAEAYRFELDALGQVVAEQGFDGLTRRYVRDAAGRVAEVQRPAGRRTRYTYDAASRLAALAHNEEATTTFAYRPDGALIAAINSTVALQFERDALGRVVREVQNGVAVDSTYDVRGQRTSLRSSLGAALELEHDAAGNLTRMQAGQAWQGLFDYDANGLELQRRLSGAVQLDWAYDAFGRPTSQRIVPAAGGPVRSRRYHWQAADQLAALDDTLTGETYFGYDALGYLTEARHADGTQELRHADAVGNLFRTAARTDRQYGQGGQLREANGTRYRYDEEGNLVRKTLASGQQWMYHWDGGGQLVSVTRPDGYAVTFSYDALGRRVTKRFRGRVTHWVWDGDKPLHEWSELEVGPGAGSVQELTTWLFEDDSFALAAKLTAKGAYSVITDHLGTPLTMYDSQGKPTWEMGLDSYGQVRQGKGKPQDCPFRYQGQYEDQETGLYYNRFRYYNPETGQYISQDPIRLEGGYSLYSYVKNSSAWVDVVGLSGSPQSAAQAAKLKEFYGTAEKANPVVESLSNTGSLPPNYVTKAQAAAHGWQPGKAVGSHVPGGQLGGDIFQNTTGILPDAPGRVWYEADIGLSSTMKRSKQPGTRLLYSNDGRMFLTADHYVSVTELGTYGGCP